MHPSERCGKKCVHEKLSAYSWGLYHIDIRLIKINMVSNWKLDNKEMINLWHDWLGHPSTRMTQKIIENSIGHTMRKVRIP